VTSTASPPAAQAAAANPGFLHNTTSGSWLLYTNDTEITHQKRDTKQAHAA
jgi:hypothetical protein